MIKAIGAQARVRMEELLGAPVYLDLWVGCCPTGVPTPRP